MFREVIRDRYYYDQWQYGMTFYLPEASCLRELDHEAIEVTLEGRRRWRQIQQQRWQRGQTILASTRQYHEITNKISDDLHVVARVLIENSNKFKIVVSINTVWIYTNEQDLLTKLADLSCIKEISFTEAVIKKPRNVILLKKPKHTHRSYFRHKKITQQQKHTLVQFLENHQNFVRLSPSLLDWMDNRFFRAQDYFFVDHTGVNWLTMLSLVCPDIIRKTMQIEQAK
jgi:hypothetical protein